MNGVNQKKSQPDAPKAKVKRSKKRVSPRKQSTLKSLASGRFLTNEAFIKQIPFLIFGFGLMMLYIWNAMTGERLSRETIDMKKEMEEARNEFIMTKSMLSDSTKQSNIAKRLDELGIEENKTPPEKIFVSKSEMSYPN